MSLTFPWRGVWREGGRRSDREGLGWPHLVCPHMVCGGLTLVVVHFTAYLILAAVRIASMFMATIAIYVANWLMRR